MDEVEIAVHLFQDRINDQCFAARTTREQIGISAGHLVEQLTEDHLKIVFRIGIVRQSGGTTRPWSRGPDWNELHPPVFPLRCGAPAGFWPRSLLCWCLRAKPGPRQRPRVPRFA